MLECTCICYQLNVLQDSKYRLLKLSVKKDNVKKNSALELRAKHSLLSNYLCLHEQ